MPPPDRPKPAPVYATIGETLVPTFDLPDPDDRHVLAAAIAGHCDAIVTSNLRHFPNATVKPFGIEVRHPDEFLCDRPDRTPDTFCEAVLKVWGRLKQPPSAVGEYPGNPSRQGLAATAAKSERFSTDMRGSCTCATASHRLRRLFGIEVHDAITVDAVTEAFDGVEDVVVGFRTPEGFRIPIVPFDEGADIRFGLSCGGVGVPPQPFARRFGEPAPDLIVPGGRGRREADMPMRSPRRPCTDGGGPAGGVVVHDDADIRSLGDAGVDPLREVQEILGPVATSRAANGGVVPFRLWSRVRRPGISGRSGGTGRVRSGTRIRLPSSTRGATARSGGDRWRPTMSRTLSVNAGGPEGPERAAATRRRSGCAEPWSAEGRPPRSWAGQPIGGGRDPVGVRRMTCATRSSPMVRGRPDRGPSDSPSGRSSGKRQHHLPTVSPWTPDSAAILFGGPSAQCQDHAVAVGRGTRHPPSAGPTLRMGSPARNQGRHRSADTASHPGNLDSRTPMTIR